MIPAYWQPERSNFLGDPLLFLHPPVMLPLCSKLGWEWNLGLAAQHVGCRVWKFSMVFSTQGSHGEGDAGDCTNWKWLYIIYWTWNRHDYTCIYVHVTYMYIYIYTLTTNLVSLLHDERGWPVMTSTYSGAFRLQKLSKRSMMNCNSSSYKVQQVDESNENGGMKQEPAKTHIWGTICNEPISDKLDAFAWISRLATNTRCPLFVWVWIQCIKHNATLAVL